MSSISAAQGSAAMIGFKSALDTMKRTGETLANDMAEGSRKIREQSEGMKSSPQQGCRRRD